jgi:hypothetical protein
VSQTCLFLKPGLWIVWQIQDLLCWTVHLEANTKMTPQMSVNSLTLYEHGGMLWWQFAAHTWNTTHSYCLKFLALVKANLKIVYLEDLTIQWWRNGQNNCKYLCTWDSIVGIVTCYRLEGSGIESRWGEIFRTYPDRLQGPPSLLYFGYRVFPRGESRPRRDADHTPPSNAKVKKGLSYTSTHPVGPPGPVTGFPLPYLRT